MEPGRYETQFRLMAKNLSEMVLAYDMDRRLTFANAAAETLTGYTVEELERAKFICWVHPDDRRRMLGYWDRLFEGKSFYEEHYRMVTRDGRLKWVAASWGPILDDAGKQVGVQGRERDVTARVMAEETQRQSEQRLRVSEERYRTLFEDSPFPMWEEDFSNVKRYLDELRASGISDLKTYFTEQRRALEECVHRIRVVDVNRAAREFYCASTKAELIGDLSKLFDDGAYEVFCEEIVALAESNPMYHSEFPTKTLRGEERTVNMIVSLVATPENDWSRVIVSFFDITDRKRLEERVLQSQKLESLGRLAGGIAHDFNNLLTVINGYSDLLLQGLKTDDPMHQGLLQIRNAGLRGAELTQQLLTFSRKQAVQLRPLSLSGLVTENEPMLHRVIGEDIRLKIKLDPDTGIVKADPGQMHQVLMNLVANARDAMPKGGVLTIETRNAMLGNSRPHVLLSIRDTGVGMDAETKQRLFEPFYTTKHGGKGTGLGLSTVFGIVTHTGGQITVESELGQGAEFNIYLPQITASLRVETPAVEERPVEKNVGIILVVEDQEDVRTLTCAILRNAGYQVLEASDGLEALLVSGDFDKKIGLLLTDVIMPGMNGKELAAGMSLTHPEMKVIFMSGYTDQIMSDDGILDSSVEFLPKPFTPARLMETVRRVMQ
jgi:PAS domain S-box-containing protein